MGSGLITRQSLSGTPQYIAIRKTFLSTTSLQCLQYTFFPNILSRESSLATSGTSFKTFNPLPLDINTHKTMLKRRKPSSAYLMIFTD